MKYSFSFSKSDCEIGNSVWVHVILSSFQYYVYKPRSEPLIEPDFVVLKVRCAFWCTNITLTLPVHKFPGKSTNFSQLQFIWPDANVSQIFSRLSKISVAFSLWWGVIFILNIQQNTSPDFLGTKIKNVLSHLIFPFPSRQFSEEYINCYPLTLAIINKYGSIFHLAYFPPLIISQMFKMQT